MDTPNISHTPRSLRVRLALSQIQLAQSAGVGERTIRNLEDGKDVSLDNLRQIAGALGVSSDDLIAAIDCERARRGAA